MRTWVNGMRCSATLAAAIALAAPLLHADTAVVGAGLNLFQISTSALPTLTANQYYGGMALDTTGRLLLAVNDYSNTAQPIYALTVSRDASGRIISVGLPSPADPYAVVPTNTLTGVGVGGGLIYNSDGSLLYDTDASGSIRTYSSGSSTVAHEDVFASQTMGGLQYVPAGFTGAGLLKASAYSGSTGAWYTILASTTTSTGPTADSFAYAPADGLAVHANSVLVEDDQTFSLTLYGVDAQGNPLPGSGALWYQGGPSIALNSGVVYDAHGHEYLFTLTDGTMWALEEQAPEPGTFFPLAAAIAGLALLRRRVTARPR
ncbi:MAG TPA: PEP-CTERM sorting domain-containing protein [Candidatus Limnocylindrales bacterium]|nr:PEP-CTERM sorting domain-containing protein [Candidatus Limnocylindrales bacterium]